MLSVARRLGRTLFGSRRRIAFLGTPTVLLICASGAFAYFLAEGSGSGSATTTLGNAPSATLTVSATITNVSNPGSALQPGDVGAVNITLTNPSSNQVHVTSIHEGAVTVDGGHSGCSPSWFSMGDPTVNSGNDIVPANGNQTYGGAVSLTETGADESACEGASINVPISVN